MMPGRWLRPEEEGNPNSVPRSDTATRRLQRVQLDVVGGEEGLVARSTQSRFLRWTRPP